MELWKIILCAVVGIFYVLFFLVFRGTTYVDVKRRAIQLGVCFCGVLFESMFDASNVLPFVSSIIFGSIWFFAYGEEFKGD